MRLRLAAQISLLAVLAGFAPKGGSAIRPAADTGLPNAIVLVVRHGEKPSEGDQLSPAGEARAKAYVKFFKNYTVDGSKLHLDHIFATAKGKNSDRERLTAAPLAKALHLEVDDRYKNKQTEELADDMKGHSYGHEILIVWHHGTIPKLLTALGADANLIPGGKWPDSHFDWVVELHFDANGKVDPSTTKLVHEHLMPGDEK